ncbi:rRNA small subunit methyltransferase I [Clostridiaceae bacterium JG1575]|nr:rRNA small subunit methyltransferase I [Clostridiaceae bacterium JG1575]
MDDTVRLYVVATPIGNLSDLSPRAVEVLQTVDLIACEDTRTTGRLLKHIHSSVPTISYHQHNEESRSEQLLEMMLQGKTLAVVSDAGMPGISDPGERLIAKAVDQGLPLSVLPGPCAFLTALVGSGLPASRFSFIGFLEKNRSARRAELQAFSQREETLIFYEAPHRLKETLALFHEVFGDRRACLARELSKLHEEYERGPLGELAQRYETKTPRGEYVLILEGFTQAQREDEARAHEAAYTVREDVLAALKQGCSKKEAIKQVARARGLSKNQVYQEVLDL